MESATETLNPARWLLIGAVVVGIVIDTMKPATLGLLLPGMGAEYGLPRSALALFPLSALTGTALAHPVTADGAYLAREGFDRYLALTERRRRALLPQPH